MSYMVLVAQVPIGNQLKAINKNELSDPVQILIICILIHNVQLPGLVTHDKVLICPILF